MAVALDELKMSMSLAEPAGFPAVEKVLHSAIANATSRNEDLDVDSLYVSEAYVNEGPRQKRVRPAPMGRAYRVVKRTSHIVVKVSEKA